MDGLWIALKLILLGQRGKNGLLFRYSAGFEQSSL